MAHNEPSAAPKPVAEHKPFIPAEPGDPRVHAQGGRLRRALRHPLRRRDGLPRAQGRPDGLGVDPDRGALDLGAAAVRQGDDPREQHRPDDRLGRRVGRGRRRVHDPGAPLPVGRRRTARGTSTTSQIMTLAAVGGILGVLMMVPLRRVADRRRSTAKLPYPEGTACADVLIAGEKGGEMARTRLRRRRRRARLQGAEQRSSRSGRRPSTFVDRRERQAAERDRLDARSRPSTSASATSSARASAGSWCRAACSRGSC